MNIVTPNINEIMRQMPDDVKKLSSGAINIRDFLMSLASRNDPMVDFNKENVEKTLEFHRKRISINHQDIENMKTLSENELKDMMNKHYNMILDDWRERETERKIRHDNLKKELKKVKKLKTSNNQHKAILLLAQNHIQSGMRLIDYWGLLDSKPQKPSFDQWKEDRIKMLYESNNDHQKAIQLAQNHIEMYERHKDKFADFVNSKIKIKHTDHYLESKENPKQKTDGGCSGCK